MPAFPCSSDLESARKACSDMKRVERRVAANRWLAAPASDAAKEGTAQPTSQQQQQQSTARGRQAVMVRRFASALGLDTPAQSLASSAGSGMRGPQPAAAAEGGRSLRGEGHGSSQGLLVNAMGSLRGPAYAPGPYTASEADRAAIGLAMADDGAEGGGAGSSCAQPSPHGADVDFPGDPVLRVELQRPLDEAARALFFYLGHRAFRGRQRAIIAAALAGHDTIVRMPTGGGKSAW